MKTSTGWVVTEGGEATAETCKVISTHRTEDAARQKAVLVRARSGLSFEQARYSIRAERIVDFLAAGGKIV
jgi:hypothetical protein